MTEVMFKRDRAIVLAGLVTIIALAWGYTVYLTSSMTSMAVNGDMGMDFNQMEMSMPNMRAWGSTDIVLTFIMWAVMMVAMMTPSATPMILMFARVNRQQYPAQTPVPGTMVFLLGYLMIWTAFSAVATVVQVGLHSAALLSTEMMSLSPLFGGIVLLLAGVYQFTPFKNACLSQCRTPLGFLLTEWRDGAKGALVMGLRHGSYCVGCCWLQMALLFVAGVMNLLWMALITVGVLVEKVVPAGQWVNRTMGLLLVGWGVWLLIRTLGA